MHQPLELAPTAHESRDAAKVAIARTTLVLGLGIVFCSTGVAVYSIKKTGSTDALDGLTRLVHAVRGNAPDPSGVLSLHASAA